MALKEPETQQSPKQGRRQTMNKKIAAYAVAAMLMGFTIMMIPLALKTGPPTYKPELQPLQPSFTDAYRDSEGTDEQQNAIRDLYGLAQPSNLLPSSLILLVGLLIAFATYLFSKRQVGQPATYFS